VQTVQTEVIPVRLVVGEAEREERQYEITWTPALLVLGPNGTVYQRFEGFLSADEYVPMLLLGKATMHFRQRRYDLASAILARIAQEYAGTTFRPEVLFYLFIAQLWSGQREAAATAQAELKSHYVDSLWARRIPD